MVWMETDSRRESGSCFITFPSQKLLYSRSVVVLFPLIYWMSSSWTTLCLKIVFALDVTRVLSPRPTTKDSNLVEVLVSDKRVTPKPLRNFWSALQYTSKACKSGYPTKHFTNKYYVFHRGGKYGLRTFPTLEEVEQQTQLWTHPTQ